MTAVTWGAATVSTVTARAVEREEVLWEDSVEAAVEAADSEAVLMVAVTLTLAAAITSVMSDAETPLSIEASFVL